MPTTSVKAPNGGLISVNHPDGASDQDILAFANEMYTQDPGVAKIPAPVPTVPLSFGGRVSKGFGDVGRGILEGGKSVGSGLLSLPRALIHAPGQVATDVGALVSNPTEAVPQQFQRAKEFAWGAVPFSQSISDIMAGKDLSLQNLAKQGTELGLSYRLPEIAKSVPTAFTKGAVKAIPGSAAEMNELAMGRVRQLPELYRPTANAAKQVYSVLDNMEAPKVYMGEVQSTAQKLLENELRLGSPDKAFVSTLKEYLTSSKSGMSFSDLQANVVDLGEKIGSVAANKGTKLNELRQLFSAFHQDAANGVPVKVSKGAPVPSPNVLETTVGPGGEYRTGPAMIPGQPIMGPGKLSPELMAKSDVWDTARSLARRDFAANELKGMIEGSIRTTGDQVHQVTTNQVVTKIEKMIELAPQNKKAKLFVESFQPGELKDIVDTLNAIGSEAPRVPPGAGVSAGSYSRIKQIGIGGLAGGPVGAMVAPIAADILSGAMMSPNGRALVRWSMAPTKGLTPEVSQVLAAYLRSQTQGSGK